MSRYAKAIDFERLRTIAESSGPARPLFAAVSGAHLYGFPSRDSDVDVRGAHVTPLAQVVGLRPARETHEVSAVVDGVKVDYVSHDVGKYLRLLAAKNGYVLEQILSPHVVVSSPEFEELRSLARGALSRSLYHHYRGFAHGRWKTFVSEEPKRAKTLLYVYRVLLAGRYLLENADVESSLPRLAAHYGHDFVDELVERKRAGESTVLERPEVERHAQRVSSLEADMQRAYESSALPDAPENTETINEFLIRMRTAEIKH